MSWFQMSPKVAHKWRLPELLKCAGLDLADPFAGEGESLADLRQGAGASAREAKPHTEDELFAGCQVFEQRPAGVREFPRCDGFEWMHSVRVFERVVQGHSLTGRIEAPRLLDGSKCRSDGAHGEPCGCCHLAYGRGACTLLLDRASRATKSATGS